MHCMYHGQHTDMMFPFFSMCIIFLIEDSCWLPLLSSGFYFTGDGAHRDEHGFYRITGRMDDVINVSGHRLGTAEIEDALVSLLLDSAREAGVLRLDFPGFHFRTCTQM